MFVLVVTKPKSRYLEPVPDGFPLDGRVRARARTRHGQDHFLASHAEEERGIGGGEIVAVAAPESDSPPAPSRDWLDRPPRVYRAARLAALPDCFRVFLVGDEVLVEVAAELDRVGLGEELHGHKCSRAPDLDEKLTPELNFI